MARSFVASNKLNASDLLNNKCKKESVASLKPMSSSMPSSSLYKTLCPSNVSSAEGSYGAMRYDNKKAATRANQQKNPLRKNQVSIYLIVKYKQLNFTWRMIIRWT